MVRRGARLRRPGERLRDAVQRRARGATRDHFSAAMGAGPARLRGLRHLLRLADLVADLAQPDAPPPHQRLRDGSRYCRHDRAVSPDAARAISLSPHRGLEAPAQLVVLPDAPDLAPSAGPVAGEHAEPGGVPWARSPPRDRRVARRRRVLARARRGARPARRDLRHRPADGARERGDDLVHHDAASTAPAHRGERSAGQHDGRAHRALARRDAPEPEPSHRAPPVPRDERAEPPAGPGGAGAPRRAAVSRASALARAPLGRPDAAPVPRCRDPRRSRRTTPREALRGRAGAAAPPAPVPRR